MIFLFRLLIFPLLFINILFADYAIVQGTRPPSRLDRLHFKSVADMHKIPQKPSYYSSQLIPLDRSKQLIYDNDYNRRYFEPWSLNKMSESIDKLTWQLRFVNRKKIYDSNYHKIKRSSIDWWIRNSNFSALNSDKRYAITLTDSNLRSFPTDTPAYRDPWKNTEGYPFDYFQHSEIHINTPLFVSHISKDGKWAFVQAAHAFGWIKLRDIAFCDAKFRRLFRSGRYMVTIKDNLYLMKNGKREALLKLGTIFPKSRYTKHLLLAVKDKKAYAKIVKIPIPSKPYLATKPFAFTPKNVAKIASQLYAEPYGWGGKDYGRDCSAMTRDFLGVFGIFLKRNSAQQAKEGKSINIKALKGVAKKRAILKYAKPFRSLLYVPGHIVLYIGHYKNEPVIMHSYWGIRQKDWSKYPLCRTIITTTSPGDELLNIRKKSELSNTLQKIINF